MSKTVFISYPSEQEAFVKELTAKLEKDDVQVLSDERLSAGLPYEEQLKSAILSADFFLVVISPQVLKSEWVLAEIKTAFDYDKHLIPVVVEKLDRGHRKYPMRLNQIEEIDATGGRDPVPKILACVLGKEIDATAARDPVPDILARRIVSVLLACCMVVYLPVRGGSFELTFTSGSGIVGIYLEFDPQHLQDQDKSNRLPHSLLGGMESEMESAKQEIEELIECEDLTRGMAVRVDGDNLVLGRQKYAASGAELFVDRVRLTRSRSKWRLSVKDDTGRWEWTRTSGSIREVMDAVSRLLESATFSHPL